MTSRLPFDRVRARGLRQGGGTGSCPLVLGGERRLVRKALGLPEALLEAVELLDQAPLVAEAPAWGGAACPSSTPLSHPAFTFATASASLPLPFPLPSPSPTCPPSPTLILTILSPLPSGFTANGLSDVTSPKSQSWTALSLTMTLSSVRRAARWAESLSV